QRVALSGLDRHATTEFLVQQRRPGPGREHKLVGVHIAGLRAKRLRVRALANEARDLALFANLDAACYEYAMEFGHEVIGPQVRVGFVEIAAGHREKRWFECRECSGVELLRGHRELATKQLVGVRVMLERFLRQ